MKFAIALTTAFLATITQGNVVPSNCPSGLPSVTYSPEEVAIRRRDTTFKLWSTLFPLSKDALLLRDQFLTMSSSDNPDWQIFASVATFWIWTYLPTLVELPHNLCSFAEIVNHTPNMAQKGGCSDMKDPLQKAVNQIELGTMIVIHYGLTNTGCGKLILDNGKPRVLPFTPYEEGPSPLFELASNETCNGGGTEYDIESMLNYIGDKYSNVPDATEDIKVILRRLYGNSLQDNVIALMTLASASPPLEGIVSNYRNEMKYTFFALGGLDSLDSYCCHKYRQDLQHIYTESLTENNRIYDYAMKTYC